MLARERNPRWRWYGCVSFQLEMFWTCGTEYHDITVIVGFLTQSPTNLPCSCYQSLQLRKCEMSTTGTVHGGVRRIVTIFVISSVPGWDVSARLCDEYTKYFICTIICTTPYIDKVKLLMCLTKYRAMKTYWRVEVSSTHSLTSALDGRERSASRPSRFSPRETTPCTHWIGGLLISTVQSSSS